MADMWDARKRAATSWATLGGVVITPISTYFNFQFLCRLSQFTDITDNQARGKGSPYLLLVNIEGSDKMKTPRREVLML